MFTDWFAGSPRDAGDNHLLALSSAVVTATQGPLKWKGDPWSNERNVFGGSDPSPGRGYVRRIRGRLLGRGFMSGGRGTPGRRMSCRQIDAVREAVSARPASPVSPMSAWADALALPRVNGLNRARVLEPFLPRQPTTSLA